MATNLNHPFSKSQEPLLINFDWQDFASGTGIVEFYLGLTHETTADSYVLSSSKFTSAGTTPVLSTNVDYYTSYTKVGDYDFDSSPLNLPRIMNGTAIISIPAELTKAAGLECYVYLIIKLRKYDGTTEEEVASVTTGTMAFGNESWLTSQFSVPRTKLKKDDRIRLTIEVWGRNTDSGNDGTFTIGVDPNGRSGSISLGTTSTLQLPFELQA